MQKSKSTSLGSKSTDTWSGLVPGFSGQVMDQAIEPLAHPDDAALTWTRADLDVLAWLMMWHACVALTWIG